MSTRTDLHRVAVLDPADYAFIGELEAWCGEDERPLNDPEAVQAVDQGPLAEGGHFQTRGTCDLCGARARYMVAFRHVGGEVVVVGHTCALKVGLASRDQLMDKAERERRAIARERAAWFAVNPDRELAFGFARYMVSEGDYGYEGMRHSFVHKVSRYGSTSDKFVAAILRDMVRTERREEERAAEAAKAQPVVAGQGVTVEGEVVSVKWQENDYGSREVWTVKDDRGFLVWGTVPGSVSPERGDRVSFVANVEASERDETFGFAKRPRKATIL